MLLLIKCFKNTIGTVIIIDDIAVILILVDPAIGRDDATPRQVIQKGVAIDDVSIKMKETEK